MRKQSAISLGTLQANVEASTGALKQKWRALEKAKDEYTKAEEEYFASQKALKAGVDSVMASSRTNL